MSNHIYINIYIAFRECLKRSMTSFESEFGTPIRALSASSYYPHNVGIELSTTHFDRKEQESQLITLPLQKVLGDDHFQQITGTNITMITRVKKAFFDQSCDLDFCLQLAH